MPILTLADAAKQLGCANEDPVMRLVSRGALKATPIPGHGIRILESDLATYVQAGALDFVAPPEETGLSVYVQDFEKAIFAAAFPQFWSDATANAKAGSAPAGTLFEQPLTFTPAIRAVVDGPVVKSSFDPTSDIANRYKSWGALYLCGMLRKYRNRATAEAKLTQGAGMYTGRADYEAILTECWKLVLRQTIRKEVNTQFEPPTGPNYTIRYILPVASFADEARLNAATTLAF